MSIEILHDKDSGKAALFCNTTDWTLFAPVFSDCDRCSDDAGEIAYQFIEFVNSRPDSNIDLRLVQPTDMATLEGKFLQYHHNTRHDHTTYCEDCGTVEIDGRCRCG